MTSLLILSCVSFIQKIIIIIANAYIVLTKCYCPRALHILSLFIPMMVL